MGFTACLFLYYWTLEDEGTVSILKVRNHTQHHVPENLNLVSCHMCLKSHSLCMVSTAIVAPVFVFTRVGTFIVATIYLQLIQNRYMFQSFTVLHCSHQHCVQPVASDVEVVGYL